MYFTKINFTMALARPSLSSWQLILDPCCLVQTNIRKVTPEHWTPPSHSSLRILHGSICVGLLLLLTNYNTFLGLKQCVFIILSFLWVRSPKDPGSHKTATQCQFGCITFWVLGSSSKLTQLLEQQNSVPCGWIPGPSVLRGYMQFPAMWPFQKQFIFTL